ncbi:hypothetical protein [Chitinophaga japonensis]|uniref:Uncharacterized protein n=1 Tax=Chitinophaga japonensis TaxID=104662 RepID=A0A562T350_CHIJA|nr:hypothetical protein [Chitinophaga japonensis]TWI87833.1 hypothetical protein LX66_1904 [Chitinophaga japonensis]
MLEEQMKYVFKGLDELITQELKPESVKATVVNPQYEEAVRDRVLTEKDRILYEIKDQVFTLRTEEESQLLIRKYHSALVVLIGKNHEYRHRHRYQTKEDRIDNLRSFLSQQLQEILHYFENEFSLFLTREKWVPITMLETIRDDLLANMDGLMKRLEGEAYGIPAPVYVVREYLQSYIERINNRVPITEHEVHYIQGIVNDIQQIGSDRGISDCPILNELLIYWNLNTKTAIDYFINTLDQLIAGYKTEAEQLEFLKLERKILQQIPDKPGSVYNPDYPSIRTYFSNYVENEITYRENKAVVFAPLADKKEAPGTEGKFKVLVSLSTDQIALLLRAADELRILMARSLRSVFRAIIPYISTPKKEDPKWDNMRSKAYSAEERDKEVVIRLLERMIEKIRSY